MAQKIIFIIASFFLFLNINVQAQEYLICTDLGPVEILIDSANAPIHAENFKSYVEDEFYVGTVFHRVIANFVVQGGGYNRDLNTRLEGDGIQLESDNGLENNRSTIAAARTNDPNSASSQFFFNLIDNNRLNRRGRNLGYTVFGEVIRGMELIDTIATLPTGPHGPFDAEVTSPMIAIRGIYSIQDNTATDLDSEITDALASENFLLASDLIDQKLAECGDIDINLIYLKAEISDLIDEKEISMRYLDEYFWYADSSNENYEDALTLYERNFFEFGDLSSAKLRFLLDNIDSDCVIPYTPFLPKGTSSELLDMQFARSSVLSFAQNLTVFGDCIDDQARARGLSDEERSQLEKTYYYALDLSEGMQRALNREIQIFNNSAN
jgi:cyclophilin family peptidyl-prolyl cis-trans isomerase